MQYKWTALIVTIVGVFLSSFGTRIVVIALPTIASQLHAGPSEVIWIGQSYLMIQVPLVLLIGRISDIYGRVRLYNIGFIVFTVGSSLAALSANADQLIVFRTLQGAGSALLTTNSTAIISDASPRRELGKFIGMNQTAFRFGSIAGLTLSGLILSFVDWRGLFYVNIPIGIFGTFLGYKKLRELAKEDPTKALDWAGCGIIGLGLLSLLLAVTFFSYGLSGLDEGLLLLAIGFLLTVFFVKRESSISFPILDLKLFKNRVFAMANIASSLNAVTWGMVVIVLTFYLQIELGYSPLLIGLSIIPLDAVYLFSSIVFGNMSDRYGSTNLSTLGLAIIGIGFLAMYAFNTATQYGEILTVLCAIGLGNGMFSSPNLSAIMSSAPAHRRGVASGFQSTMFYAGFTASYGLSVFFITLGISYSKFSLLLQGAAEPLLGVVQAKAEFLNGFHIAVLLLSLISFVTMVAIRGSKLSEVSEKT